MKNKKIICVSILCLCLTFCLYVSISSSFPPKEDRARVIITFDDNWALSSVKENALPIMNAFEFKAIVFPPTLPINKIWFQLLIQEFVNNDWEIGGHTHTHPHLNGISYEQLQHEITESKEMLESAFPYINDGFGVLTFAYSFSEGWNNETVDTLVRHTFKFVRPPVGAWHKYPTDNQGCWGKTFSTAFDSTCIQKTKEAINFARTENTWVWLMFHGVSDDAKTRYVSVKNFTSCLQLVADSGIKVTTMKDFS